jgi:hypothetical protein
VYFLKKGNTQMNYKKKQRRICKAKKWQLLLDKWGGKKSAKMFYLKIHPKHRRIDPITEG